MSLSEIIPYVTTEVLQYYKHFRNIDVNKTGAREYLGSVIEEQFHSKYDEDDIIDCIDVLPDELICAKRYCDGSDVVKTFISLHDIIETYISDAIFIRYTKPIITLNICPFDGLDLTHGVILHLCDKYFYKG